MEVKQRNHRSTRRKLYNHQSRPANARRQTRKSDTDNSQSNFVLVLAIPDVFRETVTAEWILRVSVEALWQHLLYSRQLWPIPYHQVIKSEALKKQKLMLQNLTDHWRLTTASMDVQLALLIFGPSWNRPREVYVVDPTRLGRVEGFDTSHSAKKQYTLSTRLIRELVKVDHDNSALLSMGGDQMFVCAGVSARSYDLVYANETLNPTDVKQKILDKIMLRRDFDLDRLLEKSSVQKAGRIQIEAKHEHSILGEDELVWFTLKTSLKGFKLPRGSLEI